MITLNDYRASDSRFKDVPDDQLLGYLHAKHFPSVPIEQLGLSLGYKPPEPELERHAVTDLIKSAGKRGLQMPGAMTGIADTATGLLGYGKPIGEFFTELGKSTGLELGKLGDETTLSPAAEREEQIKAELAANPDASFSDFARFYWEHPHAAGRIGASLIPDVLVAGQLGRAVGAIPGVSGFTGGMAGEGLISGGTIDTALTDKGVDPKEAGQLAGTGMLLTTALAGLGGKAANYFGVGDIQQAAAGVAGRAVQGAAPGIAKRLGVGGGIEFAQEEAQGTGELMLQNKGEGKPLTEGLAQSAVESAIGGGLASVPANIMPRPTVNDIASATTAEEAITKFIGANERDTGTRKRIDTATGAGGFNPFPVAGNAPSNVYDNYYQQASESTGLPAEFIKAVGQVESNHRQFDKEGNPKTAVAGHDFDGFAANITRYGLWQENLKLAARAFEQAKMFGD